VISPVFFSPKAEPTFFVASRGHHADIGGITPGSMPPNSCTLEDEGVVIDLMPLVAAGKFLENEILSVLSAAKHPARNPQQNIADLKAQVAANTRGMQGLVKLVERWGLETVSAYMRFVKENAALAVREVIKTLSSGRFECPLDNGSKICVEIRVDRSDARATIDFSGTSHQTESNLNAPVAITRAAVLYVFRTLVKDNIPLNDGCMEPLEIVIPKGSLLNPVYPAAVVAGNVETSQAITDTLYGALGKLAASQGTMNNFTFGNSHYQYYETICGGSGAGPDFKGTSAVQTHMTNSRLTDPEVLEQRYPVIVREFCIRHGSGGKGLYTGGDGVVRKIEFREAMTASILSQRRKTRAFGLAGGESGSCGNNSVQRMNGESEELAGTASIEMKPGDIFIIETPGGGGYGVGEVETI
jgi:N-methylhydantoinase B/oxoprolinase/acetone carboxylase alpha subunit